MVKRVLPVMNEILASGDRAVAVVTHGGVIRSMTAHYPVSYTHLIWAL